MAGGHEGTPWPHAAQETPFTWGPPSDAQTTPERGTSSTWGAPSETRAIPEVPYATWGRRWAGFLLDLVLMVIAPFALFTAFGFSLPETNNPDPPMTAASWVWLYCWLASCTVFVLYPVWFIGRRGQTPGMKRLDIRLFQVDPDGSLGPPSWKCAWGRTLAAVLGWFLFFVWILDYLWPLGDQRRQCLHDKIARAVALDERDESGAHVYGQRGPAPINDRSDGFTW